MKTKSMISLSRNAFHHRALLTTVRNIVHPRESLSLTRKVAINFVSRRLRFDPLADRSPTLKAVQQKQYAKICTEKAEEYKQYTKNSTIEAVH